MHPSFSLCVTYPNGSSICYPKPYFGKHWHLQNGSIIGDERPEMLLGEVAAEGLFSWKGNGGGGGGE